MSRYAAELGEINQLCSTELFQSFAKVNIAPWWKNAEGAKGGAIFARYDPWNTCLRVLPDSPRHFQSALRNKLISLTDASRLQAELLQLVSELLPRYQGHFRQELLEGRIGKTIREASNLPNLHLQEHQSSLFADELYAAMPWPTLGQHFTRCQFASASLSYEAIKGASSHPLRAITVAIDVVNHFPGLNLSADAILSVLRILRGGKDYSQSLAEAYRDVRKVVIPSFINGFQGAVFGVFNGLPDTLESMILGELQQFGATLAERSAWAREQECLDTLADASTLSDYTNALIGLLPPVSLLIAGSRNEKIGYKVIWEEDHLAGYQELSPSDPLMLHREISDLSMEVACMSGPVQILIKPISDLNGFNFTYTALRIRANIQRVLARMPLEGDLNPLSRSFLEAIRASLLQQIAEGRGVLAACKRLYLIDFAYQNHERGEMLMSNGKCRDFLRQTLGETNGGYHITGKAAARYESEIAKLMPSCFTFEQQTNHTLLARWRPVDWGAS